MEQSGLTRWSVDELAVLYTLQAGAPGHYRLRCIASWFDLISVCFLTSVLQAVEHDGLCLLEVWRACVCFVCVC